MTIPEPELLNTFDSDKYSLYGLWRVVSDQFDPPKAFEIGCVIGVRESDRSAAKASMSGNRPFLSAWYADSSDWSTVEEREAALEIMLQHVVKLSIKHGVA